MDPIGTTLALARRPRPLPHGLGLRGAEAAAGAGARGGVGGRGRRPRWSPASSPWPAGSRAAWRRSRRCRRISRRGSRAAAARRSGCRRWPPSSSGSIRDKNATLETALAGLDQLRARMRTLEQMGSAAEARGLFEGLVSRLDALESAQAAAAAALEAGLAARRGAGRGARPAGGARRAADAAACPEGHGARGGDRAARAARDPARRHRERPRRARAGAAEAPDLARLESRLEARIEAVAAAQGAAGAALAALEAAGSGRWPRSPRTSPACTPRRTPWSRASRGRLAALETELAARDPKGALDGFAARLDALQSRLGHCRAENPFAEISEQLTRLYAQKDATTETVLARLAPLEAQLAELQARDRDPKAALDGFARAARRAAVAPARRRRRRTPSRRSPSS